ncbi:MAG: ABC transporter substrate-binding protein [Acidobacteriia bacterium]|nr:ABC transporter substrate-binding protein [Terriglobia bacterium]
MCIGRTFAWLLAAMALAGCGGKDQSNRVRLAVAAQQAPTQMLTYLSVELGTFQSEGLAVEVHEFPGSSKALEALLGGSIDVVSGYHEQTMQLREGSPKLRSFLVMMQSHMVGLAVSPAGQDRLRSVKDLKGATVGVTSLGSATHLLLNYLLRKEGMQAEDVRPVAISTGSRALAAMERGVVDAGVVSDFTIRHLEKRFGKVVVLADTRTVEGLRNTYGVDSYPSTVLYAKVEWLERNRDLALRLVRAIEKARTWVTGRSAEDVAAKLPASQHGDDEALYVEVIRGTMAGLHPDGKMKREAAAAAARVVEFKQDAGESYTNDLVAPQ